MNPERFVERALQFDRDGDGKLNKDELIEFARSMPGRGQGGGMMGGGFGPGGPGGGFGGPGGPGGGFGGPRGGQGPEGRRGDGEAPQRPRRPE